MQSENSSGSTSLLLSSLEFYMSEYDDTRIGSFATENHRTEMISINQIIGGGLVANYTQQEPTFGFRSDLPILLGAIFFKNIFEYWGCTMVNGFSRKSSKNAHKKSHKMV